jgi:hypothetical protein
MLRWDDPEVTIKVDVIPCHAADFVSALPCQSQKFDHRTKRKPYCTTTDNDSPEFFIGEGTMP